MAAPEQQATPSPAYTPVLTDLFRLVRILYAPRAAFEEQREKPTIWMPWLIIGVIMVPIGLLMRPYTIRMVEVAIQSSGRQVPAGAAEMQATIGLVAAPIMFLVLAAISAGVMYLVLMTTAQQVRYRGLMSASVFSEVIALLQILLGVVVLRARGGPETIQSTADARISFGLDLLLPADAQVSKFVEGLLGGIGPLQIWALAVTAIGVYTLERTSKGSAWLAATASYVVMLIVGAFLGGLGG